MYYMKTNEKSELIFCKYCGHEDDEIIHKMPKLRESKIR